MAFYARVVVVEADSPDDGDRALRGHVVADEPYVRFIGDAWEVEPADRSPVTGTTFDTFSCLRAHPEHGDLLERPRWPDG